MGIKQSIDRLIRIIVPLFYTLFILCGFLSALASGLVEYHVFKQFFYSDDNDNIFILLVPLLIVIVFEVTKIFLVFYKEQLNDSSNTRKKEINLLRSILILISILSTIMFTTSKMENPEKEKNIQEYVSPHTATISMYEKELESIQANLEYEHKENGGLGKDYEKFELKKKEYQTKLKNERELKNKDVKDAKLRISDTQASDNQAVSEFLSSIWRILSNDKTYPRELYYLFVFIFALLLSIGLEIVIIATAYVIYTNHPNVLNFDDDTAHSINFTPFIKYTMFTILFMSILTLSENIDKNYLPLMMFFVGVIIFFISRKFISYDEDINYSTEETSMKTYLTPAIIGALVPLTIGILLLVLHYQEYDLLSPLLSITVSFTSAIFGEQLSVFSKKIVFK